MSAATVYRIGKSLGLLLYSISGKRRRIARVNLDIAFGDEKSELEKNRILKQCAIQHLVSLVQFLWVSHDPEKRTRELIDGEPEGLDVVQECLERGRGILFLTAHYGNWEVAAWPLTLCDANMTGVYRLVKNPYVDSYLTGMRAHELADQVRAGSPRSATVNSACRSKRTVEASIA